MAAIDAKAAKNTARFIWVRGDVKIIRPKKKTSNKPQES